MQSNRVLLDTNIVIGLFAGEPTVTDRLAAASAIFLPVPVLGELHRGAFSSARGPQNIARLEQFADEMDVLPCDSITARAYGMLKAELRTKGRPIPENDLWIAALASQHGLLILRRDQHFQAFDTLAVEFL